MMAPVMIKTRVIMEKDKGPAKDPEKPRTLESTERRFCFYVFSRRWIAVAMGSVIDFSTDGVKIERKEFGSHLYSASVGLLDLLRYIRIIYQFPLAF
jgi:hypothetical protein